MLKKFPSFSRRGGEAGVVLIVFGKFIRKKPEIQPPHQSVD